MIEGLDFNEAQFNFFLIVLIVTFGIAALFLEFSLAKSQSWSASDSIRLMGLTIVITFTIAVVVGMAMNSSDNANSLTTALMGFLGTIAGYLAGSKEIISGGQSQKLDDEITRSK